MLSFDRISLPAVFPESTLVGDGKALPSLEYVLLQRAVVPDDDDRHTLTTFLARRASSGKRLDTLMFANPPYASRGDGRYQGYDSGVELEDTGPIDPF